MLLGRRGSVSSLSSKARREILVSLCGVTRAVVMVHSGQDQAQLDSRQGKAPGFPSFPPLLADALAHSLTDSLPPLAHSLTPLLYSLTHLLTYLLTGLRTYVLAYVLTYLSTHSLTCLLTLSILFISLFLSSRMYIHIHTYVTLSVVYTCYTASSIAELPQCSVTCLSQL